MVFSIFYFSGTGNTKWAAAETVKIAEKNGHRANMYSIDNFRDKAPEYFTSPALEADCIGFANPIYGASVPAIMKDFIFFLTDEWLKEQISPKPVFVINTVGYVNAFGPFEANKLFDPDCFYLQAYCNIRLCNNVSTPKSKSVPISREQLNTRKAKAVTKLEHMILSLAKSKKMIRGIGPYLLPGILIRKRMASEIENFYRTLQVQNETCTRCMVCINNCPTHAISYDGEKFVFSDRCSACMRCYNFCSTASVLLDGKFGDPAEYVRYRGPEGEK